MVAMDVNFRLRQVELPVVGAGGADELEGKGEGAWRVVWLEAVMDGYFGGGPEGLLVEEDVGVFGVPAVEEDGGCVGSEQGQGNLRAGEAVLGRGEEFGELLEISGGQGQEDLVGELGEGAALRCEGVGGGVLVIGSVGIGGRMAGAGGAGRERQSEETEGRGQRAAA